MPLSRSISAAAPHEGPRPQRPVCWRRDSPLEAGDLERHARLLADKRPMSGRAGGYVYYWAYGRQCWRRLVTPRDPHTTAQQRSRAAFAAASKAWGRPHTLTEAQRQAWRADAAKTKSAPRLCQSGHLNGHQLFVGRNALKERWALPLLLDPLPRPREGERPSEPQFPEPKPSSNPGTTHAASRCPSPQPTPQVQQRQRVTQPSSDRLPTATPVLPVCRAWRALASGRLTRQGSPRCHSLTARVHRKARFRELWRGG